jgi:hypothetical protein
MTLGNSRTLLWIEYKFSLPNLLSKITLVWKFWHGKGRFQTRGLSVKGRQIFRHTRSPVSAIFAVVFSFISIEGKFDDFVWARTWKMSQEGINRNDRADLSCIDALDCTEPGPQELTGTSCTLKHGRLLCRLNPLRTEVYFCRQNQNAKNIGNFTTSLKPHNIGIRLKGIETSFQVVPLFLKSFHFWVSSTLFWNFLKIMLFQKINSTLVWFNSV